MKCKPFICIVLLLVSACTIKQSAEITRSPQSTKTYLPPTQTQTTSSAYCQNIIGPGVLPDRLSKTHIVYQGYNDEGKPLMWSVGMADGERVLLQDYPGTVSGLGFLQDAQHFLIAIGDGKQAWLGNVDGASVIKVDLTSDLLSNFQPYSPIWSELIGLPIDVVDYRYGRFHAPDNKTIASWRRGDKALILIDQITKQEKIIVPTNNQDTIYGWWTPDGKWFIFTYTHGSPNNYFSQLLKVNSEGTELEPLTEKFTKSSFALPVLSPDGKKIVFINRDANDTIGVLWIESGNLRFYPLGFTIPSSYGDSTIWSPDSEWIAFFSEWEHVDIRIFNISTGNMYCVTQDSIRENLMDWH